MKWSLLEVLGGHTLEEEGHFLETNTVVMIEEWPSLSSIQTKQLPNAWPFYAFILWITGDEFVVNLQTVSLFFFISLPLFLENGRDDCVPNHQTCLPLVHVISSIGNPAAGQIMRKGFPSMALKGVGNLRMNGAPYTLSRAEWLTDPALEWGYK